MCSHNYGCNLTINAFSLSQNILKSIDYHWHKIVFKVFFFGKGRKTKIALKNLWVFSHDPTGITIFNRRDTTAAVLMSQPSASMTCKCRIFVYVWWCKTVTCWWLNRIAERKGNTFNGFLFPDKNGMLSCGYL